MDSKEQTTHDDGDSSDKSNEDEAKFNQEIEPGTSHDQEDDDDKYIFEVLSTEDIVQHMVDSIKKVNAIIELPITITRLLLNHFQWDKEQLMERFYDGDQEELFAEAGIVNPFREDPTVSGSPSSRSSSSSRTSTDDTEECEICFMTLPSSMMTGFECGHRFCTECWEEYLTTKIIDGRVGQTILCAAQDCDIIIDDESVIRLVKDSTVKLKYQQSITDSFVEYNRLLKWCSSPNCTNAVKVQYVKSKPVTCKCGHIFCFQCGENWHDPVKCDLLRKWIKRCHSDFLTFSWIDKNTKECPKCKMAIEKNGGCNAMVCTNVNCETMFCWVCLEIWDLHNISSKCSRFKIEIKANIDAQKKVRLSLQRYLFYYDRYKNHMRSLNFESKLYANIKKKIQKKQHREMSWIEIQLLKKAVDTLCLCRKTLMHTYVFAFYVKKNNQTAIFEDNQQDLESAIECLSGYLERDIVNKDFEDIKQKVMDKYKYCDSRRKVLLEHVNEGYEKEWWDYDE